MKTTLSKCLARLLFVIMAWGGVSPDFIQAQETNSMEAVYDAFNKKDYETALKLLLPIAQDGNHEAQAMVGLFYSQGYGVPADDVEAARWYAASACGGNLLGQTMLAAAYFSGKGVPQSNSAALYWTEKRIEQGDEEAKPMAEYLRSLVEQENEEPSRWDLVAADMMKVGQSLMETANSIKENSSLNVDEQSFDAVSTGSESVADTSGEAEEKEDAKSKNLQNRKFLAAYRTVNRAYMRAEDNLRDMRYRPERYTHLSDEQFCREVDRLQSEMRSLRNKIESEYGASQRKSPLEDWEPERCK